MKAMLGVLLFLFSIMHAQDPSNILIYQDLLGENGNEAVIACQNLWPGANVYPCAGNPFGMWTQFNDALTTGTWDIVIVEAWEEATYDLDWEGLNSYYNNGGLLYASAWSWVEPTPEQVELLIDMGITGAGYFTEHVPHYVWNPDHPITAGISDWDWDPPWAIAFTNSYLGTGDATPLTGWTPEPSADHAAICLAPDGRSIVSGFCLAYANEDMQIWENVLQFMWNSTSLERTTWGSIKSSF